MRTAAVAILAAVASAGAAGAAQSRKVDLLRAFARQLPGVERRTDVPVLLPDALPLNGAYRLYAAGAATKRSWELSLAGAPGCRGANACFVASFQGARGGTLPGKANVSLDGGSPGVYEPVACGGSCSPASLWFTHGGTLYSWQVKDLAGKAPRATLVRLANEALAAGPRRAP